MPGREELPATVRRSPQKAQRTWVKAHDAAVEEYGEGRRAHQTAFSALKRAFEKVGDRWLPKGGKKGAGKVKGPSDEQAATPRSHRAPTAEGVDANASKQHLYEVAKSLGIHGRSRMSKDELIQAIKKENRRRTSRARKTSDA
ncbi:MULTISPECIES: ChaB family protein [Thermomonospora]|uniref:ChaB family protein n=1 Tax=Thermomonospora curvata (strain ATCC 19995 / DSM 43183 / JCM 3096 / KCTC 9072 / NBRC 15933 / NCIMB 10081 / Henssen B9) TaxID=471852 RepID=D1ADX6_THECD|nr:MULTISPECIES: ChaB family protein [Thermomonospora]ACY97586.1 ChaB family protein [Thermomonospora curvata DSM 43183]PKK14532.1 MAG: cation transport regulator ChaB [Thermomonospora sp. CIF 1]